MRLTREPLFHFFLLGAIVFGLFAWLDDSPEMPAADRVEITAQTADALARQFQQTWQRAPTDSELSALVDNFIDEEILVREALLLGLDRGDAVVRQRLALKMRFLLEAEAGLAEPDDTVLATYLAANASDFARPPLVSFEHILLSPDEASPQRLIDALQNGADPEFLRQSTLLPSGMRSVPPGAVDSVFGRGFFESMLQLPPGVWAGPVTSGYGAHLVQVTAIAQADPPTLEAVRDEVLRAWKADRAVDVFNERLALLKSRYEIVRSAGGGGTQ